MDYAKIIDHTLLKAEASKDQIRSSAMRQWNTDSILSV